MIERLGDALARFVLLRPRTTWLLLALLTLWAAVLWPRFAVEPDLTRMLPDDLPWLQRARAVEAQVAGSRSLLLVLEGPSLEQRLPALAADLRRSPHLTGVTATLAEFGGERQAAMRQAPLWFVPAATLAELERQLDDAGIAGALDRLEAVLADPFAGRELAVRDPLQLRWVLETAARASFPVPLAAGTDHLVLGDGARALLRVTGAREPYDVAFARELLEDLERAVAAHGLRATFLGGYAIARADEARIRHDLVWDSIGSAVLVSLFLAFSLRSATDPLLLFAPVALAVGWALPLGAAWWGPLAQIALSAGAVLIGLGVEIGIHWLHRYDGARASQPHDDAVRATTRGLLRPALASALTTVAGFLSLATGSFRGLAGFGLVLSLGLLLALASNLLLLPLLTRRRQPRAPRATSHWLWRAVRALHRGSAGRRLCAVLVVLAVAGAGATVWPGLSFTADPRSLRPASDPQVAAMARAEQELGIGPVPVVALLPLRPDLEATRAGLAELERRGVVRWSDGPHRLVPGPQRRAAVATLQQRAAGLPERTAAALRARGWDPEPFRPGLERFAALFAAPLPELAPQTVTVAGATFELALLYLPRSFGTLEEWRGFQGEARSLLPAGTELLGSLTLLEGARGLLIADLWRALVLAAVSVVALALLFAHDLRTAWMPLVPLALGMAITLGVLAVARVPLQLGNFVALPFLLGIGLDYGIHYVARLRAPGPASEAELAESTVALWRNCITTLLGFGSLVTAVTPGLASLGAISALGVLVSLAVTLVVLPVVLPLPLRGLR